MNYINDNIQKKNKEAVLNPSLPGSIKITDLICFSHLRWNLVFQRPQHLLTRWAKEMRVFYFEEPVFDASNENFLEINTIKNYPDLHILTPHLRPGLKEIQVNAVLRDYVDRFIRLHRIYDFILWYLTPMAVPISRHLPAKTVIYDCMDELSCFKGAHPQMLSHENMLLQFADIVFTGGYSLYEHKKNRHFNIYPFPSSIDRVHFENGFKCNEPADQAIISHPKVGFYGVIDERFDIELLGRLSNLMPDFHFIIIGPVVKIDFHELPRRENIHYLGPKKYEELPAYLAYWDVAFLPFAKNESTRFISPTKTPEYLCAEKPVVSTSIHDVADPYGILGLVHIADSVVDFADAIRTAMSQKNDENWKKKTRNFLDTNSWDLTFSKMKKIVLETLHKKEALNGKTHKIPSLSLDKDPKDSDMKLRIH